MTAPQPAALEPQDTDAAIKMLEFAFRNASTRTLQDVDLNDIALCFAEQRARLTTDRSLGAAQAEIERLRGLLVDPGSPPWENARGVLVAELRKSGFNGAAKQIAEGEGTNIPSHVALNLIALAATPPVPATSEPVGVCPDKLADDYADKYVMTTDGLDYQPGDWERELIVDALHGFIADHWPVPAISGEGEKLREAYYQGYKDGATDSDGEADMECARDGYHDFLAALATPDAAPIGSDDADYSGYVDAGDAK